jgi:hypothetical protein
MPCIITVRYQKHSTSEPHGPSFRLFPVASERLKSPMEPLTHCSDGGSELERPFSSGVTVGWRACCRDRADCRPADDEILRVLLSVWPLQLHRMPCFRMDGRPAKRPSGLGSGDLTSLPIVSRLDVTLLLSDSTAFVAVLAAFPPAAICTARDAVLDCALADLDCVLAGLDCVLADCADFFVFVLCPTS